MAFSAPSVAMVSPSHMEPQAVLPYSQSSGAFETLFGGTPRVQLGEGDLYVYIKQMHVRTKMAMGQSAFNELPSVSISMNWMSTPTYLMRVRAEYDHHDTAAAGRWGVNIADVHQRAMRQGHYQLLRTGLLYGFNPQLGEGLLHSNGAFASNLPPDTLGNTTVSTYDNGQMAVYFLNQIAALRGRMNQAGNPGKIVILGPQRTLLQFELANIVQVTSFQRPGGGTATTGTVVKDIAKDAGLEVTWAYDDTLIGKGAGGTDAVIIVCPEVHNPESQGAIDTNYFAGLQPGLAANTLQYLDMPAPREIPTPLPGGAIDIVSEMRATAGWGVRGEAITICSMPYA